MSLASIDFYDLTPEFDYVKLMGLLGHYARPREQVTKLLRSKKIIRVKKGIYILGPEFKKPYSDAILANMIFGPSYLSGLSALSFYNLIPERTEVTYSRTPNRNKVFDTPIGRFIYDVLPMRQYCVSVEKVAIDEKRSFLIASREKAIIELLQKVEGIESSEDVEDWLASMRIDTDCLPVLRLTELKEIRKVLPQRLVDYVITVVRKAKNE